MSEAIKSPSSPPPTSSRAILTDTEVRYDRQRLARGGVLARHEVPEVQYGCHPH